MHTWVRGCTPKDGDEEVVSVAEHSPAFVDPQDDYPRRDVLPDFRSMR
jgi:hypothetical protein